MKQVLFTCLLLFIISVNICAQTKGKKTNLEIFDKSISGEFEKLFFMPGVERGEKFIFYVNGYSELGSYIGDYYPPFINSVLRKTADKLKLNYSIAKGLSQFESDTSFNKFRVTIDTIITTYPKFIKNKFLGEKTLQRKLKAVLNVTIITGADRVKHDEKINIDYTDEIELDNYETYETDEYSFTKAVPPEVNVFESIFFPAILVTVSAAATILFFTIRTK